MGNVRRVEPLDRVAAEHELLAVGERARRPVGDIGDGDHRRDPAAQRHRFGRRRQQLVERAALVGLEVRERDVAQSLDRHDRGDRFAHQREHPARTGVEEERLVVDQQVLVEAEALAVGEVDRGVDAVDAVADLVDVGAGLGVGDHRVDSR